MDNKSAIYMSKNGKDTKHNRHIDRRMNLVINGEEWNLHRIVWYERVLQLAYIGTNNVRGDGLNPRLWYAMVILENWQNTYKRGVTGYIRLWRTMCS